MTAELAMSVAVVTLGVLAPWFDVRERRIPNWLTVSGLLAGLGVRAFVGWDAFLAGAAGLGIGFGLALPFFLAGGLGGGDVKLLAAFGAMLGLERIWTALLVMAFAGGALAAVVILRAGAWTRVAANLRTILSTLGSRTFTGWKGEESRAPVTLETPGALTVPYGIAISIGGLVAWFL